jgi:hypothetical protein
MALDAQQLLDLTKSSPEEAWQTVMNAPWKSAAVR